VTEDQGAQVLTALGDVNTRLDAVGTLLASVSVYVVALCFLVGVLIAVSIIEGARK
jgi:hypothetical protein